MTVVVATPPGFAWRPIPRNFTRQPDMDRRSKGLIQHVAVGGNYSLFGWFSNAAARSSSHWWAGMNPGQREQYVDPDNCRAWAQGAGNSDYHSIETAGNPEQPLTDAQIEAEAALYAWGHKRYGWPLKLAERPGEPGFGWHGMGGAAWGGHPDCPGELRKAQRADVLRLAEKLLRPSSITPSQPEGLFDMTKIKKWNNRKGVARIGKWKTMTLTDNGALTLAVGPGNVIANAYVTAQIPPGGTLQARFYEVDFGGKPTTRVTRPSPQLELSHTSGSTFGTVPFLGYMSGGPKGRSRRLRFEVCAYGPTDIPVTVDFRIAEED